MGKNAKSLLYMLCHVISAALASPEIVVQRQREARQINDDEVYDDGDDHDNDNNNNKAHHAIQLLTVHLHRLFTEEVVSIDRLCEMHCITCMYFDTLNHDILDCEAILTVRFLLCFVAKMIHPTEKVSE